MGMYQDNEVFNETVDLVVLRLRQARMDWEGDMANNEKFEKLHQTQMEYKEVIGQVLMAFQR